jgi:hypothetical protein
MADGMSRFAFVSPASRAFAMPVATDVDRPVTQHPQIIGRDHRMAMLERVIARILEHDDVWFARMVDIAGLFRSAVPPGRDTHARVWARADSAPV